MSTSTIVDESLGAQLQQISKTFDQIDIEESRGKDDDELGLKLALCHQAFERWRKSIKVVQTADPTQAEGDEEAVVSADNVVKIKDVVTNIETAIEDARLASEFSEVTVSTPSAAQDTAESENNYGLAAERIRNRIQIAYGPEDAESSSHWRLPDNTVLRQLVTELAHCVRRLVLSVSTIKTKQLSLALQDIASIAPSDDPMKQELLDTIQRASSGLDPVFYQAIQDSMGGRHLYDSNTVEGDAVATYGDQYEEGYKGGSSKSSGHVFRGNKVLGNAKAHYGDVYGKSFFGPDDHVRHVKE